MADKPIPRNWASGVGSKGKPAKQSPLVVSPLALKPVSVYDCVYITPPQYGSKPGECKREDHIWANTVSLPGLLVLKCKACKASGQIDGNDAEQKWAQLQEAMRKRDKVA